MKTSFLLVIAATTPILSAFCADGDLKENVAAAAKRLAEQSGYQWKTTLRVEGAGTFGGNSSTSGQIEKDGLMWVASTSPQTNFEFARQADKLAVVLDGNWMTLEQAVARS